MQGGGPAETGPYRPPASLKNTISTKDRCSLMCWISSRFYFKSEIPSSNIVESCIQIDPRDYISPIPTPQNDWSQRLYISHPNTTKWLTLEITYPPPQRHKMTDPRDYIPPIPTPQNDWPRLYIPSTPTPMWSAKKFHLGPYPAHPNTTQWFFCVLFDDQYIYVMYYYLWSFTSITPWLSTYWL